MSATGRVELDRAGGAAIVAIEDPAGVVLVGDLGAVDPAASGENGSPIDPSASVLAGAAIPTSGTPSSLAAGFGDSAVAEIGALGLILISVASLAVTLLRRQRLRRRLAARIAERLAALGARPGPVAGPVPATVTAGTASRPDIARAADRG